MSVQFKAPIIDRDRVLQVLRHHFGAVDATVEVTPILPTRRLGPAGKEPGPDTQAGRMLAHMRQVMVARVSDLAAIGERGVIQHLTELDFLERARHGVYKLAGLDDDLLKPRAVDLKRSPGLKRVYDLLKTPKSSHELVEALGITRGHDRLVQLGWGYVL